MMGCVSSKHLKKQALLEDIPPTRWELSHTYSINNEMPLEDYHRHLVALTSSSYGLLKVEVPETLEDVKKSTAQMASMNDMYDKLKVLESLESASKSWNEVSSVLNTFRPSLGRSISMPEPDLNKVQETINVSDIMQGLEEGLPPHDGIMQSLEEEASGSPPAQDVHSVAVSSEKPQAPPPPPLLGVLSTTRKHKQFDPHNPTQDLQMLPWNVSAMTIVKHPTLLPEEVSRVFPHPGGHHIVNAVGRLIENVQPLNAEQRCLTRSNGGDRQNQQILTKAAIIAKRSIVEDRSVCRDNPNTTISTSSRRLKFTLNLEYESTHITGTQDVPSSVGSSTRRSFVDVLTEPGSPLFDPALLASYEKAMMELREEEWNIVHGGNELSQETRLTREFDKMYLEDLPPVQVSEGLQLEPGMLSGEDNTNAKTSYDPLDEFEWKCPPDGEESVVLYTTTLRGIRKTFEDCNSIREVFLSFGIAIDERDVSMHADFRKELRELLGGPVSVPRMFIKGRYIGGMDETTKLHEEGKLSYLLEGIPKSLSNGACEGCGGIRFVPCFECSGSCKIVDQGNDMLRCPECNENGLIHCPLCS